MYVINDSIRVQPRTDREADGAAFKNNFVYYVKTDGETDTSVTGGQFSSFLTFSAARAKAVSDGVQNGGTKLYFSLASTLKTLPLTTRI